MKSYLKIISLRIVQVFFMGVIHCVIWGDYDVRALKISMFYYFFIYFFFFIMENDLNGIRIKLFDKEIRYMGPIIYSLLTMLIYGFPFLNHDVGILRFSAVFIFVMYSSYCLEYLIRTRV